MRLRNLALQIRNEHGIEETQEALGVSASSLWAWKKEVQCSLAGKKKPASVSNEARTREKSARSSEATNPEPRFIELNPRTAPLAPSSEWKVEWQRPDGARMQVSGVLSLAQIERLAQGFLFGERVTGSPS